MVKLMLEGFGGDQRKQQNRKATRPPIECFHVNARFASDMHDMGSFRPQKAYFLVKYIAESFWCRFRYGADVLYYCPAHPLKATLLRDVLILLTLRPFFRKTILHYHASGQGEWLESGAVGKLLASLGRRALGNADLSISPAAANVPDLRKFAPKQSGAVPYGIPDPCPNFETDVLPIRKTQMLARRTPAASSDEPRTNIRIFYMALCTEDKGVLDAVEALRILREQKSRFDFSLTVAGKFLNDIEEQKFRAKVKQHSLEDSVTYAGFLSGEEKNKFLAQSDVFCFPTYYSGESAPVVLLEAMAFGLPIVTTRWRNIPEFFRPDYPGIVDIKRPDQVASAILEVLQIDPVIQLREAFLQRFTIERHLSNLSRAFLAVGENDRPAFPLSEPLPEGSGRPVMNPR
jgi:glycosyltransferase involved in cell wall biosynthesis